MKSFIRNKLPIKILKYFSYIRNYQHNVYSINNPINVKTNISDFFIWSNKCKHIDFVAENTRALMLGNEVKVTHNFKFFNENGQVIYHQKHNTNKFFERIRLNLINFDFSYCSFIHYVDSDLSISEIIKKKNLGIKNNFCEQNRGYTIYYSSNDNSGSVVHGNFGGLTKNGKKMAITNAKKHLYTPIYKFKKDSNYDLVFNNPTNKMIDIFLWMNNFTNKKELTIPPLGTRFFHLKDYFGSISFESKLPICRALLFVNPESNSIGNFDVFHT